MADTSFDIPLGGSFGTANNILHAKNDIIQLNANRFVAYIHQEVQPIGYIVTYDFDDIYQSNEHTITRTELLFKNDASAARIYKISETRLMLFRDNDLYIIKENGNKFEIEKEFLNIFTIGVQNIYYYYTLGLPSPTYAHVFEGFNLKDNELITIVNEMNYGYYNPSNGSKTYYAATYKMFRLSYDPLTQELTKTEKLNFSTSPNINSTTKSYFRGLFRAEINKVPDSENYYLTFSVSLNSSSSSPPPTTPTMVYNAFMNDEGSVTQVLGIPNSNVQNAVAVQENLIIYHANAGTSITSWDGNVYTTMAMNAFEFNTSPVYDLMPIDTNHYFMMYRNCNRLRAVKVSSSIVLEINDFYVDLAAGVQNFKKTLRRYQDNLYIGYGLTGYTDIGGFYYPQFRLYRIVQN